MGGFTCHLKQYRQLVGLTQDELAIDISRAVKTPIEELFVLD